MPSQLLPFNEVRFDRAMQWFCRSYKCPLTQYDMVKLHVLADAYHVLSEGKPIIGGALARWPLGPVVKRAYDRTMSRAYRHDEGHPVEEFVITQVGQRIHIFDVPAECDVSDGDFSDSELEAMRRAWTTLMVDNRAWEDKTKFFHDKDASFMGKAFCAATSRSSPTVDWTDIIDAYDADHETDHSWLKTLIELGV